MGDDHREVIDGLLHRPGSPCISIYLPTHRRGAEIEQDPIRLRNQVKRGRGDLESLGFRRPEIDQLLDPLADMADDHELWRHQSDGLGVFLDESGMRDKARLNQPAPERVVIADSFHLRPLLEDGAEPTLDVLALTIDLVVLFEVGPGRIEEIDVELPRSVAEVNWYVDREPALQQHSDRAGSQSAHHGHEIGGWDDADVNRFFAGIDQALSARRKEDAPLVVLGVDDLVSRFTAATDREVLSPPNSGLSDPRDEEAILELTRPVLGEVAARRESSLTETLRGELGRGRAASDLVTALEATMAGRAALVALVSGAEPRWGSFDPRSLAFEEGADQHPGDVDLLDRVAVQAVQTGADLHFVSEPVDGHDLVMIPRY